MNNNVRIITTARTVYKDSWTKEIDGIWYAQIPFECNENDDTIIELIDTPEYIREHQKDFDALDNGYTKKNTCVITASHKPECDITVSIKKLSEDGGSLVINPDGSMEYISN